MLKIDIRKLFEAVRRNTYSDFTEEEKNQLIEEAGVSKTCKCRNKVKDAVNILLQRHVSTIRPKWRMASCFFFELDGETKDYITATDDDIEQYIKSAPFGWQKYLIKKH